MRFWPVPALRKLPGREKGHFRDGGGQKNGFSVMPATSDGKKTFF